ncbi:MAG: Helix-turn-helix domain [Clostridia bacterium]|nr:Helix-turn-helix domain [Clostridia bacterium]
MTKYSYEQKLQVVLDVVENHLSNSKAAGRIGACKGDAQKWVRLYQEFGVEGLMIKRGSYDGLSLFKKLITVFKSQLLM